MNSFVFYESYYEAVSTLDNDTIAEFFKMICQYALNGTEADSGNTVAKALFLASKPQLEANRKRRENGGKGGAPKGNKNAIKTTKNNLRLNNQNNQKQPKVDLKNNQKQPDLYIEDILSPTNVVDNNLLKEKEEINISSKKNVGNTFDDCYAERVSELLGDYSQAWRDSVSQKYGIENHEAALSEFKTHIVSQGRESDVIHKSLSEFKAYFANTARIGVFSDEVRRKPKPQKKRKPCEFSLISVPTGAGYDQDRVGCIWQDGKKFIVPQDVGYPPTENHYWNPDKRHYEIQE